MVVPVLSLPNCQAHPEKIQPSKLAPAIKPIHFATCRFITLPFIFAPNQGRYREPTVFSFPGPHALMEPISGWGDCAANELIVKHLGECDQGLYRLQRAAAIPAATWTTVADNIAGNGGLVTVSEPFAPAISTRFYRLILLP